jgi:hypothetical protein
VAKGGTGQHVFPLGGLRVGQAEVCVGVAKRRGLPI